MIVADTDALIDFLRGAGLADKVAVLLRKNRLCTSSISVFELWVGAIDAKEQAAVEALLKALPIVTIDQKVAKTAGEVLRTLNQEGTPLGMADCLIAGVCLENNASLLTRNIKHYKRIQGLKFTD